MHRFLYATTISHADFSPGAAALMSIAGTQPTFHLYQPAMAMTMPNRSLQNSPLMLDRFQRQRTTPAIVLTAKDKAKLASLHPQLFLKFKNLNTPDGLYESLHMYTKVQGALTPKGKKQLNKLQETGVLQNTKTDDRRSALYHLYAMLTAPRSQGYDNQTLVRETVDILSQPFVITQKFAPLSKKAAQHILQVRNNPSMSLSGTMPPLKPLTPSELNVESSATCVASSVMYYMAEKEPAELVRHLNELTSPLNAFFEKARFEEISPDNPSQALDTLAQNKIPYYISGPNEVTIKVENPPAGVIRSVDSQHTPSGHQYRNAIETAYQSALTYLATRSYDPANDMRDSDTPDETSKGLTEAEKTLMETIVKENGGVQSVTYQAVANKANPTPEEEGNSYLYGYNRPFEQTTADILQSLKMGEPVVVGTTDTDESGAIVTGHEITITGSYVDPADQQLKFIVADSDDQIPGAVVKSARELIPTIHHAGLPLRLARRINQEINANGGYFVPDQRDAVNFSLLHREPGPMPVEQESEPEQTQQTQTAQTQPFSYNNVMPGNNRPNQTGTSVNTLFPAGNQYANQAPVRPTTSNAWSTTPMQPISTANGQPGHISHQQPTTPFKPAFNPSPFNPQTGVNPFTIQPRPIAVAS
jgi:hypothetical protein